MGLSVPGHNSWPVSEPMLCSSMLNTTTAVANYRYPNVHETPICAASQDQPITKPVCSAALHAALILLQCIFIHYNSSRHTHL